MNSKDFVEHFLPFERDKDILDSWYILVSARIMKRSGETSDNALSAKMLFPDARVCSATNDSEFYKRYIKQLKDNKPFLATMVKDSVINKTNIIFLCTKNEDKLSYLPILSEFIYKTFKYPMYKYIEFSAGCDLLDVDESYALNKCDKILSKASFKSIKNDSHPGSKRKLLKDRSKEEMKKLLKKNNLYSKGMDKEEMMEMIELYLDDIV